MAQGRCIRLRLFLASEHQVLARDHLGVKVKPTVSSKDACQALPEVSGSQARRTGALVVLEQCPVGPPDAALVPLLSLTSVLMPRGQKSKLRAREKRHQSRGETQSPEGDQAQAQAQEHRRALACGCHHVRVPCLMSRERVRSPEGASSNVSQVTATMDTYGKDPLTRKASKLVQFLLEKYRSQEPVTQVALLKVVNKKYKPHFAEILRRACDRMELVFGLELKEVNRSNPTYILVNKLGLSSEEDLSGGVGMPKTGFLMALLGVIFMKGNRASEEEVWEFLNVLGVHAGRRHLIFGEPRKFITQDLVQAKYLEYRQVAGSDPPTYEFLWGPRAHAETTKMKVLSVLAKISHTTPSAFPGLYEEALCDEVERASLRCLARARSGGQARVPSGAKPPSSPHT
ncbi:PREDICTED: melanoma-associated antigen B4-like [Condylura cristata]|uniref:melanoma-associated antigen B4-like n=1 Tax=Condylura cristata TaxID=143302 RepID=UPI000642FFA5|nr:PREDICTED: melanoma-associated antigen B4-like [Condylura cristata]